MGLKYIDKLTGIYEIKENAINKNGTIKQPILENIKELARNEIKDKYDLGEIEAEYKYKILHERKREVDEVIFVPVKIVAKIYREIPDEI